MNNDLYNKEYKEYIKKFQEKTLIDLAKSTPNNNQNTGNDNSNNKNNDDAIVLTDNDIKRIEKAYVTALDIRKFEIDMYWKRASYFWLFIGACFVGFKFTGNNGNTEYAFLLSCLGLFLSVAFWLANRGSKFWQENWESHVDLLEDFVVGSLYKQIVAPDKMSRYKLLGSWPFSVSKINMAVSVMLMIFWLVIVLGQLLGECEAFIKCYQIWIKYTKLGEFIFTIIAIFVMFRCCQNKEAISGKNKTKKKIIVPRSVNL